VGKLLPARTESNGSRQQDSKGDLHGWFSRGVYLNCLFGLLYETGDWFLNEIKFVARSW
jgi:hypothetical protein